MAGSFSNFFELELLDHAFGGASMPYSPPATLYLALYTGAPTDAGAGTECSGGSYARVSVTNNSTNWPAAAAGAKANGVAFEFPTATGDWGTCVAMGIFDAVSGGNLLAWADLTVNKDVSTGDTAKFPIGNIDITLD